MKETTLMIIRYICFIIGFGMAFTCIYFQSIDYEEPIIIGIMALIIVVSLLFFSMGFIFIDIEKGSQSIDNVSKD